MAVYVYAVTTADHPLRLDGLQGVGGQEAPPLRAVRGAEAAAVIGEVPEALRVKRRHLMAHHKVLTALTEQGPVLPMRFGVLAEDDTSVQEDLDRRGEAYRERLEELRGKVEYRVRAEQSEDDAVQSAVRGDAEVRRLVAAGVAEGPMQGRIALGERVQADVEEAHRRMRDRIAGTLQAVSADSTAGGAGLAAPGSAAQVFADLSFLVEQERSGEFAQAARQIADALAAEGVRLNVDGPLPPYSFTDLEGRG
ncbi:GvpL/GvpF family gas vesicle protein [Phaeacidiphilus oryzae]|uniref:GvpL/GvpF family gas vesicle protein n=1 Tax=Phaeacidiphilus oryzae TaxID=348818 RepID=UPI000567A521|nr:GvpL/GvpF family gas vesicle protein [Phaeacidiphilus oryzae]